MIHVKSVLKNRKDFLKALFINTFSFSIYIIAQQLLFMPLMGKWLDEEIFAHFVIYIAFFSILSNSLGSELGIVNQVDEDNDATNYGKVLLTVSIISTVVSLVVLLILGFSVPDSIVLSVVVFIANYRLYASGYFRKRKKFNKVLIQNILYLLGMGIGLVLFFHTRIIWLPSFLAELFSIPYSIMKSDLAQKIEKKPSRTQMRRFFSFSFVSFLNNLITYLDKIIIYPILGPLAVDTYYSTTAMSKIANMIVNPLHGVLLSWIKNKNKKSIIKKFIIVSIPSAVISFLLCIPFTYVALKILYPQFLENAMPIIIPVSIALGASIGSALLKSLLIKYSGNKKLIRIYIRYFAIFLFTAFASSYLWGLIGFSVSMAVTKMFLYFEFIYSLKRIDKENE